VNGQFVKQTKMSAEIPNFPEAQRIYATVLMPDTGNGMKRMIWIILVLIALVLSAQSKPIVNLGGKEGNLILGGLTNNSTINSSINLSQNASVLSLGGEDGNSMLENLTNASKNLSDWGSEPPKAPLPPNFDPKRAKTIAILRANHGF
jgi:hypothetical protein